VAHGATGEAEESAGNETKKYTFSPGRYLLKEEK
jgi:hypothetical protein